MYSTFKNIEYNRISVEINILHFKFVTYSKFLVQLKLLIVSGSVDKFQGLTVIYPGHFRALVYCFPTLIVCITILTIFFIFHNLQIGLDLDVDSRDPEQQ